MRQPSRWIALCLLLWAWLPLVAIAADAAKLPERDVREVRTVIEAQLKALSDGDAARAFSFASPSIHQQFGDADNFFAMVQQGYPMVIRPAGVSFFLPEVQADGTVLQVVQMRDAAGRRWLASYQMQRQADQRWRINGCAVRPDTGLSASVVEVLRSA